MSKYNFKVDISPKEAVDLLKKYEDADLVYEEMNDLGEGKHIGTIVFEKYFFRTKNRAALVVIIDNIRGFTEVRAVATGSSQGLIFNFDWGAADDFAYSVKRVLESYIVE